MCCFNATRLIYLGCVQTRDEVDEKLWTDPLEWTLYFAYISTRWQHHTNIRGSRGHGISSDATHSKTKAFKQHSETFISYS